jgi:hypothetical protein
MRPEPTVMSAAAPAIGDHAGERGSKHCHDRLDRREERKRRGVVMRVNQEDDRREDDRHQRGVLKVDPGPQRVDARVVPAPKRRIGFTDLDRILRAKRLVHRHCARQHRPRRKGVAAYKA